MRGRACLPRKQPSWVQPRRATHYLHQSTSRFLASAVTRCAQTNSRNHRALPKIQLDSWIRSRRLSDHGDLRDRMNFPRGAAPVFRIAGSDVFRLFGVTGVDVEPAFEFTPAADQLRLQSLFGPVDSLIRGPVAQLRRDLENDLFALRRLFAVRDQKVDV